MRINNLLARHVVPNRFRATANWSRCRHKIKYWATAHAAERSGLQALRRGRNFVPNLCGSAAVPLERFKALAT
jgi:hypothetical protein